MDMQRFIAFLVALVFVFCFLGVFLGHLAWWGMCCLLDAVGEWLHKSDSEWSKPVRASERTQTVN